MKNGRKPVNVIDNNYWDLMWKVASGNLTVTTSTFIILDPIDPDNPHDVYISDEAADLYLANMGAKCRLAAGPYFDPAVNIKNMHDDRESVANAAVVSIRINALADDKAVIDKLAKGDANAAACPALDEIFLDGGLYKYHTNADSANTSICAFTGVGWMSTGRVGNVNLGARYIRSICQFTQRTCTVLNVQPIMPKLFLSSHSMMAAVVMHPHILPCG